MLRKEDDRNIPCVPKHRQGDNTEPTLDEQLEYWKYWQTTRSESEVALKRADVILEMVRNLQLHLPRILDLGCGNGWFTSKLDDLAQVTGIDLNEEAMFEAQKRWPHIRFVGGSLFEHPFEANSFDIVISQQVIAHVEDQLAYIDIAEKLLRPGGYFLLSTNNKFVMDRLRGKDWGSHRDFGHIEKWLSVRSLRRLVSHRFDMKHVRTLFPNGNVGVLRIVNSRIFNTILGFLIPNSYVQLVKERLGFGYYILMLAQKPIKE